MRECICPPHHSDRLDKIIAELFVDVSRTEARRLIAAGSVFVDGRRSRIASRLVHAGQRVQIGDAPASSGRALVILHEDAACLAIDKPAGMPTAPTQTGAAGTALDLMQKAIGGTAGKASLWVVHRLDAATSGVLLFAKTRAAAAQLSEAFREQLVRKTYVARVGGRVAGESGVIELALAREDGKAIVSSTGKAAATEWRVLQSDNTTTLLELHPRTGRMHQIRVHLQAVGHPVLGDRLYGGAPAPRMMLHAARIELPVLGGSGKPSTIEAPIPAALRGGLS